MNRDMLDKAAVPELAGATESIATPRQRFEGQACVLCQAAGDSNTRTIYPSNIHTTSPRMGGPTAGCKSDLTKHHPGKGS